MKTNKIDEKIEIPEGITISYENGIYTVKGPKGEVQKKMLHPKIKVTTDATSILLNVVKATKRELKIVNTYRAHIKNLFKGVTEGHLYKLKICSGHFPMNVSIKGNHFEIKNFIGEKVPRTLKIKEGATVKIDGDAVVVEGIDKELTSQTAASIEQLTRRPGFDTRVFQDGIFITDKDGKLIK